MALIGYTITVVAKQDNPYNVLPETDISIRKNSDNSLVNIYADEAGLIPIAQLGAKTDSNGQFTFYADASLGTLKAVTSSGTELLDRNSLQSLSGLTEPSDLDLRFVKRVDIKPPVLGRDSRFQITDSKVALRYGISDPLPLDDTLNNYRGLASGKDSWGNINNLGVGSAAFGRNNAAFAYLSFGLGHDCITYGTASMAGGAGSATGNPDDPNNDAIYGYCSFAYGKNSVALGRVSHSIGEECFSNSDQSSTSGLRAEAGPCIAGMPNPIGAGPVISAGIGAIAHGIDVKAYGDSAIAIGQNIKSYNGAKTFGYGINTGSPIVNAIPGAVGIAANSDVMAIQVTPAPGTNGGFSRIGQNTLYPNQRYESMLKNTDKIAYRLDEGETGATFSLQRTVGGVISDVVSITFNNAGVGALLINGQQVVGNRAAAIPDALTDANKIQAILDTLRYHGLIAN